MDYKIKKIWFWNGIQTIKINIFLNQIETNFENYFNYFWNKIRKRKINFKKAKKLYQQEVKGRLPLWLRLCLIKEKNRISTNDTDNCL